MKKILIPVDGSEYSKKAIEKGLEFVSAMDLSVVLATVIDISPYMSLGTVYTLPSEMRREAENYLKTAREEFKEYSERVSTVLLEGNPAKEIIEYAENKDIDLIIMGSRGAGSKFHRLMIGSVALKVLESVQIPVLVVK